MLSDAVKHLGLLCKNKFCSEWRAYSASIKSSNLCQLIREVSGMRNNDNTILPMDINKMLAYIMLKILGIINNSSEQSIYLFEYKLGLNNICKAFEKNTSDNNADFFF